MTRELFPPLEQRGFLGAEQEVFLGATFFFFILTTLSGLMAYFWTGSAAFFSVVALPVRRRRVRVGAALLAFIGPLGFGGILRDLLKLGDRGVVL